MPRKTPKKLEANARAIHTAISNLSLALRDFRTISVAQSPKQSGIKYVLDLIEKRCAEYILAFNKMNSL